MKRFLLFYKDEKDNTLYVSIGGKNKTSRFKEEATVFTDETYSKCTILLDNDKKYFKYYVSDYALITVAGNGKVFYYTNNFCFEESSNDIRIYDSQEKVMEKYIQLKEQTNSSNNIIIIKRQNSNHDWTLVNIKNNDLSLKEMILALNFANALNECYKGKSDYEKSLLEDDMTGFKIYAKKVFTMLKSYIDIKQFNKEKKLLK